MIKTRSKELYDALEDYLKPAITDQIIARNEADGDLYLQDVREWSKGYKDVLAGARQYPAILFMEQRRSHPENYITRYAIEIGFALKGGMDQGLLADQGEAYCDILEDVILADHTLGGMCVDSNNLEIESGYVGSVFVASCTLDIDVDRGGF